jgi:S1-C subfamily serine protease
MKTKLLLLSALFIIVSMACVITFPGRTTAPVKRATPAHKNAPESAAQPTSSLPKSPASTAVSLTTSAPLVVSNEDELLVELYKHANPAVVNIITYVTQPDKSSQPESQGSGWLFDNQGHIVTNSHVVHGADSLDVVFSDNTILEGTVLGQDLHSDLAVIEVKNLPEGIEPLPLGDISQVEVGQTVLAIGNPFGLGGTLTRGIVSALGRSIPALTAFQIPQAIQTDAPINPGNSGGPLLNLSGQVIGVNAQIETADGSRVNSGVGFAIPVSIVARVIPSLIEKGKFEWGWMGVMGGSVTPAMVQAMSLPVNKGAYVSSTISGGPADKAGLHGSSSQTEVH